MSSQIFFKDGGSGLSSVKYTCAGDGIFAVAVSQWSHIDALIMWLTINDNLRCCLRLISPPEVGTLCSTWNVGPANVPVMGSQDH